VAGSARAMAATGLIGVLALGGLAGCVTTQDKNERAKLRSTRLLEGRKAQRLGPANPDVRVERVSLVRGRRTSAIVVDLRNSVRRPLTDLPIRVGVRTRRGRRVPLNAGRNQGWFQTHLPAIDARGRTTWVFTRRTRGMPAGRPFARVGTPHGPAVSSAASLPEIEAVPAGALRRRAVRVRVDNRSQVPQFDLQVYAYVTRRGRYVAAGKAVVRQLDHGTDATARVRLTGPGRGGSTRVHAIPTIFR
jgi:hypothetical protein